MLNIYIYIYVHTTLGPHKDLTTVLSNDGTLAFARSAY